MFKISTMRLHKVAIPTLVFCIMACTPSKKGGDAIANKWLGKEIILPEKPIFTRLMKDTIAFNISQATMKIVTYADTADCMGCKLQLNKWKEFMSAVSSSVRNDTIPFLFFIYPKDMEEIEYLLQSENFSYPICIDIDDRLNKLNCFSSDICLLLDEKNHVIATGNPILDSDIKKLYLEKITGQKISSNLIMTTAETDHTQIDLGTLEKSTVKEIPVKIKNTGNAPLVIFDIDTSCGCITASFDKRPIKSGEETEIKLKLVPTEIGFIQKTVRVKANIDKAITINLQGNTTE